MAIAEMKIADFLDSLGSAAPTPGGGGASSVCGALACALGAMVCNITIPKPKYAENKAELEKSVASLNRLGKAFLQLADRDAEAFAPLAAAYSMPKQTEAEKAAKDEVMEQALAAAARPPLEMMETCCTTIAELERVLKAGSKLVLSDAAVGASFARAALESAALNVYANTKLMKDRDIAQELDKKAGWMLREYIPRAEAVYESVKQTLALQ